MKKIVTLAIAAAAALAASPAAAQSVQFSDDGSYRVSVSYGDLNLASAAGKRRFEGRLKAAANVVCGLPRPMGLIDAREMDSCRETILDNAKPQLALAFRGAGNGSVTLTADR